MSLLTGEYEWKYGFSREEIRVIKLPLNCRITVPIYHSVQEMQPLKCMPLPSSNRLATTFQVGGVVVENQVNSFRRVLVLAPVISCSSVGPNRRSADQNQEYFMEKNNKFKINLPLFLLTSSAKF
jgi:hypothetical protein